jgi:hypothetical protein
MYRSAACTKASITDHHRVAGGGALTFVQSTDRLAGASILCPPLSRPDRVEALMPGPRFPHRSLQGLFVVCILGLAGCGTRSASPGDAAPAARQDGQEPGGIVLTQKDISAMGVRDAYHAVERAATHLNIQRTREGSPVKITQRGVSSFLLSADILVVVDGARVQTVVDHLKNIPAESILYIQILTAREGSARYGSDAGNGVIMVRTSAM